MDDPDTARSAAADVLPEAVQRWRDSGHGLVVGDHEVFMIDQPATREVGLDPLLVLHGFPSCSFDFRHVLPALNADRRVVLFDFLGFGLSDKPDQRYSLRAQADVAMAVVAAAGLDRVAMLTHDMGDSIGGELLARDLEGELGFEVTERVLTNGSIYIDMAHLTAGQKLLLSLPDARLDIPGDHGDNFKQGLAATFGPLHPAEADELEAQWHLLAYHRGNTLLPRTIRYVEDRRVEERRFTGAIETHPSPLGVVWGDADPVALHTMTGPLLGARPDTPLITLEAVGHYPMIEAPKRFSDAVRRLLANPAA